MLRNQSINTDLERFAESHRMSENAAQTLGICERGNLVHDMTRKSERILGLPNIADEIGPQKANAANLESNMTAKEELVQESHEPDAVSHWTSAPAIDKSAPHRCCRCSPPRDHMNRERFC